jgi:hypothetical protein
MRTFVPYSASNFVSDHRDLAGEYYHLLTSENLIQLGEFHDTKRDRLSLIQFLLRSLQLVFANDRNRDKLHRRVRHP